MKRKHLSSAFRILTLAVLALSAACSREPVQKERHLTFGHFLDRLTGYDHLPVLDDADIRLLSSHDRTGGNNDFNYFVRPSKDPGWMVITEQEGPGVVHRWWMTGTDPGHLLRVYIDGEKEPRIEGTLEEIFGERAPWLPPLAQYVNMCFYSYVPIPFNESIRIETQQPNTHPFWGPRRIFFQIGVEFFDGETTSVESYPEVLTPGQLAAMDRIRTEWDGRINAYDTPAFAGASDSTVPAGAEAVLYEQSGGGTIKSFQIHTVPAGDISAVDREYLLQDVVLRVFYDGASEPSIDVPLGDFFGNAWRKRAYGSVWFTSGEDGYTSRLPMPYRNGIRFMLLNGSDHELSVSFSVNRDENIADRAGYLHAEYRRSGPGGALPHLVTEINGRGKFMGCFLGVTGLGASWWILEGDESMWVDGQSRPVWQGTGLEDYFNGGWYYRGSVLGAFNGNFDRSAYRVAQYRHQHTDPVSFQRYFRMEFERMREERTGQPVQGYFESVSYSYREAPGRVLPVPADREARRAVENPNDQSMFMLQLVELERLNDFHGARRFIEEYLERWPDAPDAGVYRLRHLEYRRYLGESIDPAEFASYLNGEHGEEAARQAGLLQWFYEKPGRTLIGMNVNGRGRLMIDGETLMAGDHPFHLYVIGRELNDGPHQIAAQVEFQRGDPWLQVGIRTVDGVAGTGPGTRDAREVNADWATAPAVVPPWHSIGIRNIPRGVPDAPYIGGIANAFILLQSKSYPVSGQDWGYYRGTMYFREDFQMPLKGMPDFALPMTGLLE